MTAGKYTGLFRGSFRSQTIYRSTTFFSILSSLLFFYIQVSLWRTLIGSGIRQGVTFPQMIAYVMINSVMNVFTQADFADELGAEIRDGSVVMHFLRPVSLQLSMLSRMLGKNAYHFLTVALPVLLIGILTVGMPLPPSALHGLLFLALAVCGILILFLLGYIVGLMAFWLQATWYLSWYLRAGLTFFGGTTVPLWFYPDFLNQLSRFLPFRYMSFEAISCYLGTNTLAQSLASLGIAAAWIVALYGIGSLVWRRVQVKMTVNGG